MSIEAFSLADLRKMVAFRPMGWTRFDYGDLLLSHGDRKEYAKWVEKFRRKRFYTASDTLAYVGGTVWTWSDSGGTPTFNCTLQNLASGSARQGVKSTTTIVAPPNGGTNAVPPDFFSVQLTATFGTTPTTGGEVQVYLSFSPSGTAGTSNPGQASGTDAAYSASNTYPQMTFAGSLLASADGTTSAQIQTPFAVVNTDPTNSPYVSPVILNTAGTGQSLKNTANTSTLTVVPYWRQRAS